MVLERPRATECQQGGGVRVPVVDEHRRRHIQLKVDPLQEHVGSVIWAQRQREVFIRAVASPSLTARVVQHAAARRGRASTDQHLTACSGTHGQSKERKPILQESHHRFVNFMRSTNTMNRS